MGLLDTLFGKKVDFAALIANGAKIVDVRTAAEFKGGHVKGAVNIPLDRIQGEVAKLKKEGKPIILCCASGMRSGNATSILQAAGIDAHNGGSWSSLNRYV
jgi:phage shock protein E